MLVLTKNTLRNEQLSARNDAKPKLVQLLWKRYMAYAEKQAKENVLWYMKVIMVIPCVLMVPMIFLMAMITTSYLWFIALCILLFFANVIMHIAEAKSTLYVPFYHATIFTMIVLPLIAYLFSL